MYVYIYIFRASGKEGKNSLNGVGTGLFLSKAIWKEWERMERINHNAIHVMALRPLAPVPLSISSP